MAEAFIEGKLLMREGSEADLEDSLHAGTYISIWREDQNDRQRG